MAKRDQLVLQHRPAQLACASQLAQHKPTTGHVPSAGTQLQAILTAHSTESTTNMPPQPWVPMPCAQDCHVTPQECEFKYRPELSRQPFRGCSSNAYEGCNETRCTQSARGGPVMSWPRFRHPAYSWMSALSCSPTLSSRPPIRFSKPYCMHATGYVRQGSQGPAPSSNSAAATHNQMRVLQDTLKPSSADLQTAAAPAPCDVPGPLHTPACWQGWAAPPAWTASHNGSA